MFRFSANTAALLLVITAVASARACTICVGLPAKSDADYLIESHCVILAREDHGRPFAFAPVEVLKGEFDGREIDLLVDSLTRRRLAANEERKVVLVQRQENAPWRSLGIASADFEAVARRVLLLAPSWDGEAGRAKRVAFFIPLFGHEDSQINRLAYLEMGRAPYQVISRLGRVVPRAHYAAMLEDRKYIGWRPLAILLLAQSHSPDDAGYIRDSLESAQQHQLTTNLAAWATAAIEVDRLRAVAYLEKRYCLRSDRTPEELREVAKAFSLHGTEDTGELRERIIAAYRVLLKTHPSMAALVARDVHAWKRTDLADQLRQIEASRSGKDNTFLPVEIIAGSSGR